jgi:hypothetical protein
MPVSVRSGISRLAGAAAAIWLCGVGSAWAGDGGSSGISLQGACDSFAMMFFETNCPPLPTLTQQVIEFTGLSSEPPNIVRSLNSVCGPNSQSGLTCPQVAVNAVNGLATSPPADSNDGLSYLTPLAFKPGPVATQYGDPTATSFFYAVTLTGTNGQPQLLDLILDNTAGTNKKFSKGPVVSFSLPLVVLQNGTEYPVAATLLLTATCNGAASCLTGTVSGTFPVVGAKTFSAAALGINFNYSFGASPNSTTSHAIVELQIPLVVTMQNDPAYFTTSSCPVGVNPFSQDCLAFSENAVGFPANFLGEGASVGIAPYPAPLCTGTTCPATPPTPPAVSPSFFGFCASFSNNPVIAAFASIGTDGTTYASTPTPGAASTTQCPPQN